MHASHAFVTYRDGRGAILRNLYGLWSPKGKLRWDGHWSIMHASGCVQRGLLPRRIHDLKSTYCFCAHMHEITKYFLFSENQEQCLRLNQWPSHLISDHPIWSELSLGSLYRFFYRSMTPSSAPRADSDLKSKYCFCTHMHEMMKYFMFTEIHKQCLNQLSGPSWESSICRRIDRVTIPYSPLARRQFRSSGIYTGTRRQCM